MKLNYKLIGQGAPVVILHGLFGMLDNWRTIARMMEDKYQCILVDLRNHGRSPHSEEMNYKVMAEDILDLLNDLHLDIVFLMGHSMGGKVAMQFACEHSDKVDKLIVVDIAPKKYQSHHHAEIDAIKSIHPSELKNRSEAEELLTAYLGDDQATIQFLLKNLARIPEDGFEWKANMPVLIAHYDDLMDNISTRNTYNKPVLFLRGQQSNSVSDEDWTEIKSLFPNAVESIISNAGHWVHADQPETFTHQVLAFLKS
ncbi:MAG: alpha/beta fold hydrolase [Saprospiraceae bacterium]